MSATDDLKEPAPATRGSADHQATSAQVLRNVIREYASQRGLVLGPSRLREPDLFVFSLDIPPEALRLDQELIDDPRDTMEVILCEVDAAAGRLLKRARETISRVDRSPTDRLDQIEAAARALLAKVPYWDQPKEVNDLRQLLDTKRGAVCWRKDLSDPKVAK